MSWTYTDTADQVIAVTECTTELVDMHIGINAWDGRSVIVCIPADKRRDAAQAVAGDEWQVVSAKQTGDDDHSRYTYDASCPKCRDREVQATIADHSACGLTEDPHGPCPACGRPITLAEREALAQPDFAAPAQRVYEQLRRLGYNIDPPQPDRPDLSSDRPAPVDPASVRVGDYVHVESVDRYVNIGPEWAVQGAIAQDHGSLVSIRADDGWISVSRGHGVWHVLRPAEPEPVDPESGAGLIAAERARQINDEGRTAEHDDGHPLGELLDAATTYLLRDPAYWPWEGPIKLTPDDRVRELVKAGALIAAEIDRMQRAEPEPDEAAVEALYEALRDVYPKAVWDLREGANLLARRGVRVVSTDA